jgi:LuxR family maltose regulon positive regulatory protein
MPPENPLTRRERQVIRMLATDLSQQDIADKLVISPHTLNTHTKNIYRKLEVCKRAEAVRRAREMDLLP